MNSNYSFSCNETYWNEFQNNCEQTCFDTAKFDQCDIGLVLPFLIEIPLPTGLRAVLYLLALLYLFVGISIISDVFMCAIEKITSKTRIVTIDGVDREIKIWNDTIANLTLMALGSSAPEICLSLIEVLLVKHFQIGDLGPSTIVGSAAFNLLVITAVCISIVDDSRKINNKRVFLTTTFWSIFAYIWLYIILEVSSKGEIELWEAIVTFLFFPIVVLTSYLVEVFPKWYKKKYGHGLCVKCIPGDKEADEDEDKVEFVADLTAYQRKKMFDNSPIPSAELCNFIKFLDNYTTIDPNVILSEAEKSKLIAAKNYESIKTSYNRNYYRITGIRGLTGGRRPEIKLPKKLEEVYKKYKSQENNKTPNQLKNNIFHDKSDKGTKAVVEFTSEKLSIIESSGSAGKDIKIERTGNLEHEFKIKVASTNVNAIEGKNYEKIDQELTFQRLETEKTIKCIVMSDGEQGDRVFSVDISLVVEQPNVVIGTNKCTITIIDDDILDEIQFEKAECILSEGTGKYEIKVLRELKAKRFLSTEPATATVSFVISNATAYADKEFKIQNEKILNFNNRFEKDGKEYEIAMISCEILSITKLVDINLKRYFTISLVNPSKGHCLGMIPKCTVQIMSQKDFDNINKMMKQIVDANLDEITLVKNTWTDQFKDAMNVNGGDTENATLQDYINHFISFPWKVMFAFVPPAGWCSQIFHGWLSFFCSLFIIAVLTALVNDVASIFGCLVGLKDSVTAITFVALGTSLPDTFASAIAARKEKSADNAIGNITGSNSVNVFMGLGLPWLIVSIYKYHINEKFLVNSSGLAFSIALYTTVSMVAFLLLFLRRILPFFGKAELGGSKVSKYLSSGILVTLWLIYVTLASLKEYGIILSD